MSPFLEIMWFTIRWSRDSLEIWVPWDLAQSCWNQYSLFEGYYTSSGATNVIIIFIYRWHGTVAATQCSFSKKGGPAIPPHTTLRLADCVIPVDEIYVELKTNIGTNIKTGAFLFKFCNIPWKVFILDCPIFNVKMLVAFRMTFNDMNMIFHILEIAMCNGAQDMFVFF